MRRLLAIALVLFASSAQAQNYLSDDAEYHSVVQGTTNGQILFNSSGSLAGETVCTMAQGCLGGSQAAATTGQVPVLAGGIYVPTTITPGIVAGTANTVVSTNSAGTTGSNNIITGQNYLAAGTNTGEAFGYSFRNSTTTGTSIYTGINVTVPNVQDGLQSVLVIPSTATVGQATTFASYFQNNATGTVNAVGFFAAGQCVTTGSPCWGTNLLLTDSLTRTPGAGTGRILLNEYDFNVTQTGTQIIGASYGGNGTAQSSNAIGVIINSLSGAVPGTYKWQTGFTCMNAVVSGSCLNIGALAASGTNINSQNLAFQYFNSASASKTVTITAVPLQLQIYNNETETDLSIGFGGSSQGKLLLSGATSGATILQVIGAASGILTLPNATDTLVGKATTDILTNKTLDTSVGKGTWTASGTWTLPAFTLGGTVSGGGQQLNNVVIGTTTPLAGAFTTLSATGQITSTLAIGTAPFVVTSTTQVANLYVARAALADAAAIGTITGLGTGVATALAVNVGTAGSFVVNGGALGSPSSAGTIPAHTLGGTIAGGGNQINNVVIGASSPANGTFTQVGGTSLVINGSTSLGAAASLIAFTPTITNTGATVTLVNSNPLFNGAGDGPTGYASQPQFIPSASVNSVAGGYFGGYASPSTGVTISDAYASKFYWQFTNDVGAVTRAHAVYVGAPVIFGALKPTTYYGVHVANQGASGITTSYGIYIDAQSGSATNVAFNNADTLDATSSTVASNVMSGGLAVAKQVFVGTSITATTFVKASAHIATGSAPTGTTGSCVASSFTGGSTAGKFLAATCAAGTIILSALPTAPTGYSCSAQDQTTPADTLKQTANTTTSVTFTSTTVSADSIAFGCIAW